MPAITMDEIVALAKRRGFIFQSASLYGGCQGLYDFGPMGVEMKQHLKQRWWRDMVYERGDVEGVDTSILTHRLVLRYSGHEDTFSDPMVDCRDCNVRWRADHIAGQCLACGGKNLTEPRPFNLMFSTQLGPLVEEGSKVYLRPETAQGIFTQFRNVADVTARTVPFGIAQMGKSFRNEITPRQFIFRVREFEQMELEFFVAPGTDDEWHAYWVEARQRWWIEQGLHPDRLKQQPQAPDELSHYSKATTDLLYQFPHGFEELEGIANRMDYDLGSHSKDQASLNLNAQVMPNTDSTQKLALQNRQTGQWFVPYVIEPSCGVERGVLALLTEAYTHEKEPVDRVLLKLKPHVAPVKAAVVPLAKNQADQLLCAERLVSTLRRHLSGRVCLENTGNIGKSYRRHDEIGTPACITVDFETMDSEHENYQTVTVRDRDTTTQTRVSCDALPAYLKDHYAY